MGGEARLLGAGFYPGGQRGAGNRCRLLDLSYGTWGRLGLKAMYLHDDEGFQLGTVRGVSNYGERAAVTWKLLGRHLS